MTKFDAFYIVGGFANLMLSAVPGNTLTFRAVSAIVGMLALAYEML